MRNNLRKAVSVLLCVCMIFSVLSFSGSASEKTETVTVSCEEELKNLKRDIPVIFVNGLQGEYYKGLSTETEEDDVRIWAPGTDVILDAVKENVFGLLWNLIIKNYAEATRIAGKAAETVFGDFACDKNGNPDPDTGKKDKSDYILETANGYDNAYGFVYDWRLDMLTLAAQLDDYTNYVMELTGSDKVAYVAMSMGTAVMSTYLHEYYYTAEDYAQRNHIESVVFLAGGLNGVSTCEDPLSGNMGVDSTSLMRMMSELMRGNEGTKGIYTFLEILYSLGLIDPLVEYVDNLNDGLIANGLGDAVTSTVGSIPGFLALMSAERYEQARDFIFSTPEKKAEYAKVLEKSDYYHRTVQKNCVSVINSMLGDGVKVAVIAEYGYTIIPITSDNDRMTDGVIATDRESLGATCAEVDGTFGENYQQAKPCVCGKNHVSADNQIDASTCAFPDVTWFCKYLRHSEDAKFFADLIDLIIYSDKQMTVWDYAEYPQYLVNLDGEKLVPLTKENAGEIVPFEETTIIKKMF